MKIPFNIIEDATKKRVKLNTKVIGFDIATRTGICEITTTKKEAILKWYYIEFDKTTPLSKYKTMIASFEELITPDIKLNVIEDTHLRYFKNPYTKRLQPQVTVLKELTRYGAYAISKSIREGVRFKLIGASTGRKEIGVHAKRGKAKECVAKWLKDNLEIDLKGDDDVSDAIILALLGIIK